MKIKISKCRNCGEDFIMGYTGTVDGCDKCTGVERDSRGYAWEQGEEYQDYEDVTTGEFTREYRQEVFGVKGK